MSISTVSRSAAAPQVRTCPSWCVVDHGNDPIDDIFHRSDYMQVGIPDDQVHLSDADLKLTAHVCLPEVPEPGDENGFLVLDHGDLFGPYAELDLEHCDQFIRDLKTFTARIEQARDWIAAKKEQQS
ncbi:hypothetical protein AB0M89_36790 [Streptomyces microflavus]|uniref:DUF6907 domain-containing protein n=1 Tax=Streptomyces microflavus TaxID=1919 RepID=UPI00341A6CC7